MGFNYPENVHNPYNHNNYYLQDSSSIIGVWKCESDNNWKMVFTANNRCYHYTKEVLTRTDSFIISNTTPQCGEDVPVDSTTSYLQLNNLADTSNHICYEINGITNKYLSLRPVWTGGVIIFDRQ